MPRRRPHRRSLLPDDYFGRSQLPLQSLFFLLPLVVLYEVGTLIYATDYQHGTTLYIQARLWLLGFFQWFGVSGFLLPGLIVVAALVGWHIARKDRWELEPKLYLIMLIESAALAVPLLFFMSVMSRHPAPAAYAIDGLQLTLGAGQVSPWQAQAVFAIGAGIYEELLFRLVAIALLHFLLVDVLAVPDIWGSLAAIAISSVAFALYHFSGNRDFAWTPFFLYTAAGVYLACVYVLRGIGIAAGTHAVYDILVIVVRLL
ncbi:MAG: CPBP family intramembrane glutamic endopeptidase [Phycisphaeraceae bacterium]